MVLIFVITSPPLMTDGAVRKRGKEAQTLRADLSTKHVGDDSRDPENKKAREKSGNKHEGNSNVGDDRKYPGWVWRPATLLQQRP
ncbi:TPA: hypothetical protein ACOEVN_003488 [Klebsiella pneumoniae]|uniref:hypothetical protein n=1 Tax=Klebsiella pneumoniae TaxID=573 RepID=UPI0014382900|nr:hypothetical protein [Klebsiella pneumoniae]NWG55771.1 hypothetical protein [Klebsiella pneumoniae]